jgi:hypothetical protein
LACLFFWGSCSKLVFCWVMLHVTLTCTCRENGFALVLCNPLCPHSGILSQQVRETFASSGVTHKMSCRVYV